MDTTKVNKEELLERLRANRAEHIKEFNSARKEWKKRCRKALKKELARVDEGKDPNLNFLVNFPKPKVYTKDFDRVISRLEMEVDDVVELESREFTAWVMNDWDWQREFVGTTSLYNG